MYGEVAVRQGPMPLEKLLDATILEASKVSRPQPREMQPARGHVRSAVRSLRFENSRLWWETLSAGWPCLPGCARPAGPYLSLFDGRVLGSSGSRAFRKDRDGVGAYEAKSALSWSRSTPFSPKIRTSTGRAPPSGCTASVFGGCGKEHLKRVLVIPPKTCSTLTDSTEQFGITRGRMRRAEPAGSAGSNAAPMFGEAR